ncbi:MAG: CBS domain-containing protein [Azonexaceae bacterium]|uniref:CBS domain-containing protein n=1 Tax=Azonexus sp. R2A61 TaxID=2744443 RepID=UPI001F238916|nr:CBS domain-containing protein [Azonexus sp. R2A61]MCE1238962.1 CBS domain-containing protein [Azonexaceae bacterium]
MQVKEILRVKGGALFSIRPQDALAAAVERMAESDVGSLVVLDGGRLVGMLTFREVMQVLKRQGGKLDGLTVSDVMVLDPVTVPQEMEANDLRRLMIDKHSRYLPVIDGEQLLGVISFLDVAKAVLEEQSLENRMLKSYIKNWPAEDAA